MSGQNSERVACPRCQANNFAGQTQCWRCQASLPPPEARPGGAPVGFPAQPPPPLQPTPMIYPPAPANGSLRGLQIAVGLIAFLIVLFAGWRLTQKQATSLSTPTAFAPSTPTLPPQAEAPTSPPRESADPATAQAQREIQRFRQENGLYPPDPPPSSDGRIRLRSGGSISQEEWENARRKVKESPLFKEPPPPGPL